MLEGFRSGDLGLFLSRSVHLRPLSSPRALRFHNSEGGFHNREGGFHIGVSIIHIGVSIIHKNVSSCFSVCLLFLPLMVIPLFHPRRAVSVGRLSITALILAQFYLVTA